MMMMMMCHEILFDTIKYDHKSFDDDNIIKSDYELSINGDAVESSH